MWPNVRGTPESCSRCVRRHPTVLAALAVAFAASVWPIVHARQPQLIARVDRIVEIRRLLATGQFFPSAITLTPCEPDRPVAFTGIRGVAGLWAGRFKVERQAPGAWTLAVQSDDG